MKPLSIKTRLLRAQTLAEAQEIMKEGYEWKEQMRLAGFWNRPHPSTIRKWQRIIRERWGV